MKMEKFKLAMCIYANRHNRWYHCWDDLKMNIAVWIHCSSYAAYSPEIVAGVLSAMKMNTTNSFLYKCLCATSYTQ